MTDQTDDDTDEAGPSPSPQEPTLKDNLRAGSTWMRGLNILLFLIIYGLAKTVVIAVMIFQFLSTLFIRRTNKQLVTFAVSLCAYIYEVVRYLSYASDERPFPFKDWPKSTGETKET